MANLDKLVEIGAVVLEVFETIQEVFEKNGSNDILSVGDSLMFLTTKSLGFSGNGSLSGDFAKVGQVILNLSEVFLIGIVLVFAFRCLFGYLAYKKTEIPWRFFLRMVIVGILAGGAFYFCFVAVSFTENVTEYVRSYLGKEKVSFEVLEEKVEKLEFKKIKEEEVINLFDSDNIVNMVAYFSSIFVSFSMGIRYFLLEIFILSSPIFILFAGFKESKWLFSGWMKLFLGLLSSQVIVAILLGVFSFQHFGDSKISSILLAACLILMMKMNQFIFRKSL